MGDIVGFNEYKLREVYKCTNIAHNCIFVTQEGYTIPQTINTASNKLQLSLSDGTIRVFVNKGMELDNFIYMEERNGQMQ